MGESERGRESGCRGGGGSVWEAMNEKVYMGDVPEGKGGEEKRRMTRRRRRRRGCMGWYTVRANGM